VGTKYQLNVTNQTQPIKTTNMTEMLTNKETTLKVGQQIQTNKFIEDKLWYKIEQWQLLTDRDKLSLTGTALENEIKVLQNKYCSTKINY
jgi:hypothetical protein